MKKIFYANRNHKKAEVAILTLNKINFNSKSITKDVRGHYITIKGPMKRILKCKLYIPNIGAPEHIKQILTGLQREIDNIQ